jgi:hypothetical protein
VAPCTRMPCVGTQRARGQRMRFAMAAWFLVGCTVNASPTPTAAVQLHNREGVPLADWPVMFHGADGVRLALGTTNSGGRVAGPMEPDGYVTYRSPFPNNELVTRGGVQPDDVIVDGGAPEVAVGERRSFVVGTSQVPASGSLCQIQLVCGDRAFERRGVPNHDITIDVPVGCIVNDAIHVYATATDERYEVVAYAILPSVPLAAGRLEITEWRTDFTDTIATVRGLAPDLDRYRIEATAFSASAPIAHIIHDGNGPTASIDAPIHLPAGLPGASHYRFRALFATGEITIEQQLAAGTPLVVGPTDLPPPITAMELDRSERVITFATKHPLEGDVSVGAVMIAADASWRLVNMPGPTVALPELDASEFPFLPYFSLASLELHELHATTRTRDLVRTTAVPYVSSPDL